MIYSKLTKDVLKMYLLSIWDILVMKLSVVVMWFNPNEKYIENLRTYHSFVERIL